MKKNDFDVKSGHSGMPKGNKAVATYVECAHDVTWTRHHDTTARAGIELHQMTCEHAFAFGSRRSAVANLVEPTLVCLDPSEAIRQSRRIGLPVETPDFPDD